MYREAHGILTDLLSTLSELYTDRRFIVAKGFYGHSESVNFTPTRIYQTSVPGRGSLPRLEDSVSM